MREEGSEAGAGPRLCGHLKTILSLLPFPACWEPSCSCHYPRASRSLKTQLPPCPVLFSYRQMRSWIRLPVYTGRLVVSCSGICSCQKNYEGSERSHSPRTAGRRENLGLASPGKTLPVSHGRCLGSRPGQSAPGFSTNVSFLKRGVW